MAAAGTTFAANADNVDVATLNDALGSAGVDLKARLTLCVCCHYAE